MTNTTKLAIGFLILCTLGCGLFSGGNATTEVAVFNKTTVGSPTGPATKKSIGPDGGSISSPDGRITVTIPPKVASSTTEFSIEPVTNQAEGGIGTAYRLGPEGTTFGQPVTVSFRLAEEELKKSAIDTIAIASQDETGTWRPIADATLDESNRTVTISTTHSSDYSALTVHIAPEKTTLRVGQTQALSLRGCWHTLNPLTRIRKWFGKGELNCGSYRATDVRSWTVDIGTIVGNGANAEYTAPAKRPSRTVATVRVEFRSPGSSDSQFEVRTAQITIIDDSYRVSGNAGGDTVFSGVICDITKPFTIKSTNPFLGGFNFTPADANSGSWGFAMRGGVTGGGSGKYTLEGGDVKTSMLMSGFSTACIPVGCRSGGGDVRLTLTPLDSTDCS